MGTKEISEMKYKHIVFLSIVCFHDANPMCTESRHATDSQLSNLSNRDGNYTEILFSKSDDTKWTVKQMQRFEKFQVDFDFRKLQQLEKLSHLGYCNSYITFLESHIKSSDHLMFDLETDDYSKKVRNIISALHSKHLENKETLERIKKRFEKEPTIYM